MATMRPVLRRFDANAIVLLLAGLLCGAALMAGITLIHPLKQKAASPVIVYSPAGVSDGVVGGRLGGITSDDAAVDAATRQNVTTGSQSVATNTNAAADDYLHAGLVGAVPELRQEAAEPLGGRVGGLQSADTPNDAATKNEVGASILNGHDSNSAGQRDVNAADQSVQNDVYPIFVPGHAW